MHIREVKVKRKGTTHRYTQLVKSYRRPDGMPAHKVIAGLGTLPPQAVANLKAALAASRQGKALVLPSADVDTLAPMPVLANLRYLDVAVALTIWNYWNLSGLLKSIIPTTDKEVASCDVVAALVIQRCVAPRSKLYAQKWFPTTALPELLGILPAQFNNTRIHRVLDELDGAGAKLQESMPWLYQQKEGIFTALFLDLTDAYFEGNGCEMAERHRTKEGLRNMRRIGIVLLCNQEGYPLRWQVVPGKKKDFHAMGEVIKSIKGLSWARRTPLVCDRAMGSAGEVIKLFKSGIWFLTAARVSEIEAYTIKIPHQCFADIQPEAGGNSYENEIQHVAKVPRKAGMERVNDSLYVLDLGVCYKETMTTKIVIEHDTDKSSACAAYLAQAVSFGQQIEAGIVENQAQLAKKLGLSRARITQIMNYLRLAPDIQEQLLGGPAGNIPDRFIHPLCLIHDGDKQREQFYRLLREHNITDDQQKPFKAKIKPRSKKMFNQDLNFLLVVYFNPQMFVDQRLRAKQLLEEIFTFIDNINHRLSQPQSRRKKESVRQEVLHKLKALNLLSAFDLSISSKNNRPVKVKLNLKKEPWERRRRYDGFVLLIGHPDLPQNAAEIARLYRAKDAIEKDFYTIKSVIKLRPIYHYTDTKVRAHITLCMLALLLERTLECNLKQTSQKSTAAACLEELSTCHLNQLEAHPNLGTMYTVTRLTNKQQAFLKALDLEHLGADKEVAEMIIPR